MRAGISLVAGMVLSIAGCSSSGKSHISQAELLQLIESGKAPVIIDVRSESEYAAGHIPGAKHLAFWSAFTIESLDNYPADELLVLYCEHGPRAGIAKMGLGISGFDNMVYLEGHMSSWRAARLPVELNGVSTD